MRPTWLFEADVFGTTAEPLKAEVRRQGMACLVTRQALLAAGVGWLPPAGACVVACGCFPFVHFVRANFLWVPGGWCNPDTLACSAYYPHFDRYLLNRRRLILPGVEAIRDRERVFAEVGRDGEVFVRPDGCQKLFTGRVVAEDEFAAALAPSRYDPATLVVVAEPRAIGREWRLIVAEGAVVAGGQYLVDGAVTVGPGCPDEVLAFARGVLADVAWRPDDIFMMDVCDSEDGLHLIELNGFSCSAVYPCDCGAVVEAASALAFRAWEQGSASGRACPGRV